MLLTSGDGVAAGRRGPHLPERRELLPLIQALTVEMPGLEAHRYLQMDDLREHKKEAVRMAA